MIFPLFFERLCCEHLINFTPLFSPLRIFKHRFFALYDFVSLIARKFSINLTKYREKWNIYVPDNSSDI